MRIYTYQKQDRLMHNNNNENNTNNKSYSMYIHRERCIYIYI